MFKELNTLLPIDVRNPVNRNHILARGLVAWWLAIPNLFGGQTFYDLIGGNHGTFISDGNPTVFGWNITNRRPGGYGQVLFDNLRTDYIIINNPSPILQNVNLGPFTLSCWVYINTWLNDTGIFFVNSIGLSQIHNTSYGVIGSDNNNHANAPITIATWQHILATFDGTNYNFYLNGQLSTQAFIPDNGFGQTNNYRLGIGFNNSAMLGYLDDIRVYNRGLSSLEVQSLYINSLQGYPNLLNRINLFPPNPTLKLYLELFRIDNLGVILQVGKPQIGHI